MPELITQVTPAAEVAKQPGGVNWILIIAIVVIGIILAAVAFAVVYFVGKWIVGFIKKRSDLYYNFRKRCFELAGMHAITKIHRWRITKNIPIKTITEDASGKIRISQPIAYYGGHYYSHTGNIIIRIFSEQFKQMFIIPKEELLIVNAKASRSYRTTNEQGKNDTPTQDDLPINLVQFNDTEVLLFAHGIDNADSEGLYYIPTLFDKDHNIIDLSIAAYDSVRDIALGDAILGNSKLFVEASRKAVDINPYVRISQKVTDNNQSVETMKNQNGGQTQ